MTRPEPLGSMLRTSSSTAPPLRVGLVLDKARLTRSEALVVDDLEAAAFVTLAIVVLDEHPPGDDTPGLVWRLYRQLDERRVRLADDPLSPAEGPPRLADVDVISVGADGPDEVALGRVRAASLDVLVDLTARDRPKAWPAVATNGRWRLTIGDPTRYRGDPPAAWETLESDPVTAVALVRCPDDDQSRLVLATAAFATDPFSVARNRARAMFSGAHLVVQGLRDLHAFGPNRLADRAVRAARPLRPIGGGPGNLRVLRWLLPRGARMIASRLLRRLRLRDGVVYWKIATRPRRNGAGLADELDMTGFRWIDAPPGHLYADPFVAERDGRAWLFFEDHELARRGAVIAAAELRVDASIGPPERVLETAGHLSFPHVFFVGDEAYMIPESSSEGVVRLYRAADFPRGWSVEAELWNAPGLDTVAFEHEGRWWFFTTIREARGQGYLLLLFHAASLTAEWIPHPLNPISTDVRVARGAGAVLRIGDRLIRPSQDCSRGYGHAFGFQEIVRLTTTDYAERTMLSVGPDWSPGLVGTHTYSRSASFEASDGKVIRDRRAIG